ncbi:MAG: hypothetical protein ABFS45_18040 [Pseudomonadota bacterium]
MSVPWELVDTPLDFGTFNYRMRYLQTPTVTLYREQIGLGCQVQGLSPPNIFAFPVPLNLGGTLKRLEDTSSQARTSGNVTGHQPEENELS